MQELLSLKKELYFTTDYEWIDFRGLFAQTGICRFKLLGFKQIERIDWNNPMGYKQKGEVLATIHYRDYVIEAHMPVDGTVIQLNEALLNGHFDLLLQQPEEAGWIALLHPAQPIERKDLLLPEQYRRRFVGKNTSSLN